MKLFPNLQKLLLMATVLTVAIGCSSDPVVQDYPVTANASEEVTKLENNIKAAQDNQVDVLSPNNFEEAREALQDAKEMHAKGKAPEKVLREVAVGNAYLTNANSVADVARNNAEDIINARQAAISAGASSYFSKDMK